MEPAEQPFSILLSFSDLFHGIRSLLPFYWVSTDEEGVSDRVEDVASRHLEDLRASPIREEATHGFGFPDQGDERLVEL